jgi:hypothetical protein
MAELGTDISCVEDLDPAFTVVSGVQALSQALARRFITPRTGLFYDDEYGLDLRAYLNAGIGQGTGFEYRLGAAVEAECLKDERVASVEAVVSFNTTTEKLTIAISGLTSTATSFRLTLAISSVTVELLRS